MMQEFLTLLSQFDGWFVNTWWKIALIILIAWLVNRFDNIIIGKIIRKTVRRRGQSDIGVRDLKKRQNTLISLYRNCLRVLVWLIAIFSIINLIPLIDLTPLLAYASVIGVALGFGAQTIVKDFLSGLFIILENQYRVGDVVELDKSTGTVEQVTLRSTMIRDNDGNVHYIPNSTITHSVNKTKGYSIINISVEVDSSTDIDKLVKVINDVGKKMQSEEKWKDKIIEPPKFLGIDSFDSSIIEAKITGRVQPSEQWTITDALRQQLIIAFKKSKIITKKIDGAGTDSE